MNELVEDFFRHESGRLVAVLSRRVGVQHLEVVEDAVQCALLRALESWKTSAVPDDPSAWLFRVAHNEVVGALRTGARRRRILGAADGPSAVDEVEPLLTSEVQDDLLRMLFVCCDERIPADSQLVLSLKTLCGFDVREISLRLFISEANVYKRLSRARSRLRELRPSFDDLSEAQRCTRRASVQRILYVMFTEGYLSSHASEPIRRELCAEAIRLGEVLAAHTAGQSPETDALLALMHLHAARMTGREDNAGGLLLLEEQDRSLWDQRRIHIGLTWLQRSAKGEVFSRYHAEAGIAAEHCLAPSFERTRWDRVVECYELLERVAPSPIHRLNRAVAVAECKDPDAGLEVIAGFEPPTWLAGSYLWSAVLADLHRRAGHAEEAQRYRRTALATAPSPAVRALLQRRLNAVH